MERVYGLNKLNSLNAIRLFLAMLVVYSHSFELSGIKGGIELSGRSLGGWSVLLFFMISGYLISASAFSNSVTTYFKKRILRIFPAYLVSQVIVTFVFSVVATLIVGGTLHDWFTTKVTPLTYLTSNLFLKVRHYNIGNSLSTVPFKNVWNGSTWTLWNEFFAYILILFIVKLFLKKKSKLRNSFFLALLWILSIAMTYNIGLVRPLINPIVDFSLFIPLFSAFLAGALLYSLKEVVPIHIVGVSVSIIAVLLLFFLNVKNVAELGGLFMIYIIVYFANIVRTPKWLKENDLSYGVYVWSFPIQQFIMLLSVTYALHVSWIVYFSLSALISMMVAFLSWRFVEQPALQLSKK